jgi:hypothetical protein
VNLWDCLSHDVFKNLDLSNKKIHIQNAMTVSAGFNKKGYSNVSKSMYIRCTITIVFQ